MAERALHQCRVLIVEDEYFVAEDLRHELTEAGAVVVGMAGSVNEALGMIRAEATLDVAVIDMNLGGTPVFAVADLLTERGVPFVITTGYEASAIPPRFDHAVRCEKPFNTAALLRSISQVIRS
jgi:DNA-binding NtrC family response regulator